MSEELQVEPEAVLGLADQIGSAAGVIGGLRAHDLLAGAVAALPGAQSGGALAEAAQALDAVLAAVAPRLESVSAVATASAVNYEETDAAFAVQVGTTAGKCNGANAITIDQLAAVGLSRCR